MTKIDLEQTMNQPATIDRARELGLPTLEGFGNEEQTPLSTGLGSERQGVESCFSEFWFTKVDELPRRVLIHKRHWPALKAGEASWHHVLGNIQRGVSVFITEKEAIETARKLRIAEIDRLQNEVNALDERHDAIENAEMASK